MAVRTMFLNSNFEILRFRPPRDAAIACTMFLNSNFEMPNTDDGGHGRSRRDQQLSRHTTPTSSDDCTFVGTMSMLYLASSSNGTSNCVVHTDSSPGWM